ncbi:hypothetical protein ACHAWF_007813 [Thalassiosira exigua]
MDGAVADADADANADDEHDVVVADDEKNGVEDAIDAALEEFLKSTRRDTDCESQQCPAPALDDPSVSVETLRRLLSSNFVKLSPAEAGRARSARSKYPLFKDASEEVPRRTESYFHDEIPFLLRSRSRRSLAGTYDVYYHDGFINWCGLQGWDIPPTPVPREGGRILVAPKAAGSNQLAGYLYHVPAFVESDRSDDEGFSGGEDESHGDANYYDDDEGYSRGEDESGHDGEEGYSGRDGENGSDGESQSRSSANDYDNDERYRDKGDESGSSYESRSHSDVNDGSDSISSEEGGRMYDDSVVDGDGDDEEGEGWEDQSNSISVMSSHSTMSMFNKWVFFQFDESRFDHERDYEEASWFDSGMDFSFALIRHAQSREVEVAHVDEYNGYDSVTLFMIDESMAFERGEKQHFISLNNPANYGIECGSHFGTFPWNLREDERHQMKVIEKMRAYRGSWICKLCPEGMELPEGVAHLIAEYWQTAPPPYLFVNKGDLLLLARYEQTIPDPDFPDNLSARIAREHIILARRQRDEDS